MQTTMALMTNVIPEIDIPVIVAGSIVDGRGMAAALLMGADGVQMGSRFLLAEECQVHQNSKDAIIASTDTDSVITGFTRNNNVRGLRSAFTDEYLRLEREGAADDVLTGQGLNRLTKIQPAKEIVDEIIHEMTERLQNAPQLLK